MGILSYFLHILGLNEHPNCLVNTLDGNEGYLGVNVELVCAALGDDRFGKTKARRLVYSALKLGYRSAFGRLMPL